MASRNLCLAVLLGSFLAPLASSQTPSAQQPSTPDSPPPQRIDLAGTVEVPIALEGNLPIVDATVNGQGPFRFGIETGAGVVVISPELAAKLALKRTGGPDNIPEYHVDRLDIGGVVFHEFSVSAMRVAQGGIDGVLGLPLYRDLLMTIDYAHRRARFERGNLPAADGVTVLDLTHIGPFWGIPISVGGVKQRAVLDTRSTGGFGFTPESAAPLTFEGDLRVIGRARGAAIPETDVKAGRLAGDVTIGRYTFPKPTVSIRPLPPGFPTEAIVGTRVLSQFVLTLDQRNARLRLTRDGSDTIVLDEPAPAAPARSTEYAGRYGTREIRLQEGKLVLQREGGPALEMVATGPDTFTLKEVPQAQFQFLRDAAGAVTAVKILNREGQWETVPRDR
ncbi:MAG TPA: aspartyl protease family protein [Vicinamibacterales bacterium]